MYFIGIDGGGTKTDFALSDETGKIISRSQDIGISYRQYPLSEIIERINQGVLACIEPIGLSVYDIRGMCIGYPCYGESEVNDNAVNNALISKFSSIPISIVNDVEIGWMGALEGKNGIHVVAGTGSIAFGKNHVGRKARCGGWLDFFSDEGSGYWLGRKTMELFSMQADGRKPEGELLYLLRNKFSLKDDLLFIDIMAEEYIPYREKVASLQLSLLEAAHMGDRTAKHLYWLATRELVRLVSALRKRLRLEDDFLVSYSGSLFKENELVLKPFISMVERQGGRVVPPQNSPIEGALMLAIHQNERK